MFTVATSIVFWNWDALDWFKCCIIKLYSWKESHKSWKYLYIFLIIDTNTLYLRTQKNAFFFNILWKIIFQCVNFDKKKWELLFCIAFNYQLFHQICFHIISVMTILILWFFKLAKIVLAFREMPKCNIHYFFVH